ncbi:probable cytochrome P450 9f2 [Culicoides brevitarsis]|uniref:probable cytochrome P450 9f2 n=1 Tax=Culicoides brevitarsis TaxID=469753 RepID=UPI00307B95BE
MWESILTVIVTTIVICVSFYHVVTKNNGYFKERGVVFVKPTFFLGSLASAITKKKSYMEVYIEILKNHPEQGFVGIFDFLKPLYILKDPELIKQVCIKDGDNFLDHRFTVDPSVEPIVGRNLFAIKGNRWRKMRKVLSPAFSLAKMRFMFQLIRECAERTVAYVDLHENSFEFEAVDFLSRFSNDIIATTAFGLEVNSLKDPKNDFYKHGRIISCLATVLFTLKFILSNTLPWIMKSLKITILDKESVTFFRNIILKTLHERENTKISRPDLIHLLLEAKNKGRILEENETEEIFEKTSNLIDWTEDDFVAQCLVFFMAGFETSSMTMTFMSYELALNKNIQNRLHEEIITAWDNLGDRHPTYEDINKLKYLDMVLSETLRKWTPVTGVDRVCSSPYVLEDSSGQSVTLNVGDAVFIPLIALHHDPNFFAEPEKFDPERFSDENKDAIVSGAYLPFGIGPRYCIGNRFGSMEIKTFFFYMLRKYEIDFVKETENSIKVKLGSFNVTPANDLHLKYRLRR